MWVTLGRDAFGLKLPVYICKHLGKPGRCVPSIFNAEIQGHLLESELSPGQSQYVMLLKEGHRDGEEGMDSTAML